MTDSKSATRLCEEDLVVRARRGELRDDEQALFHDVVRVSPALRAAYEVGTAFDGATVVRAGDDELIQRASGAALAALARPRPRHARRAWLVMAAAVMFGSTAVAASLGLGPAALRWFSSSSVAPATATSSVAVAGARAKAHGDAPAAHGTPATGNAAAGGSSLPEHTTRAARSPQPASSAPAAPVVTAAELFSTANALRRAGDFSKATRAYAELQRRFPNTDEARVSHVSLGKLLLAEGRAREAEIQFRNYDRLGGGTLSEEALVGRAEALAAQGRVEEEVREWRALLSQHPASVYAARARVRLHALEAARDASP